MPEGLIATGCTGRYVYALGYFQHVVYQFDTATEGLKKVVVGSVGGHISRNFLVDLNEHAYVPRVTELPDGAYRAELVELDTELKEVVVHPLENYAASPNFDSHGIVGFSTLINGNIMFLTSKGDLYRLKPGRDQPSVMERFGWIHPGGESYTAFLACPDGGQTLCAVSRRHGGKYEWLTYDILARRGSVLELDATSRALLDRPSALVYGSNTIDDQGNAFIGGWLQVPRGKGPYVLRVQWPDETAN